MLVFFVDN